MIGEALRLIRTIKGYKARDLAQKLAISPSYLSQIEKGQKRPSYELIEKFAEAVEERTSTIVFFSEEYTKLKNNPLSVVTRPVIMKFLRAIANDDSTYQRED